MKRGILLTMVGFGAVALAGAITEQLNQAAWLYLNRHLNSGYLEQSKVLYETILAQNPTNEEALWQLARVYFSLGDCAQDRKTKFARYERGKTLAESLIKINESHPEGHFWFLVNQGRIGQTRGVLNSLFMVPTIKRELKRTLELNPRHAGAHDGWGMLYYELPGFAGGNLDKAIDWFRKGIAIDPHYSLIYVDLARAYIKKKMFKEAREALRTVINDKNPTYPADYFLDDKPEAERLLKEIEGK